MKNDGFLVRDLKGQWYLIVEVMKLYKLTDFQLMKDSTRKSLWYQKYNKNFLLTI